MLQIEANCSADNDELGRTGECLKIHTEDVDDLECRALMGTCENRYHGNALGDESSSSSAEGEAEANSVNADVALMPSADNLISTLIGATETAITLNSGFSDKSLTGDLHPAGSPP